MHGGLTYGIGTFSSDILDRLGQTKWNHKSAYVNPVEVSCQLPAEVPARRLIPTASPQTYITPFDMISKHSRIFYLTWAKCLNNERYLQN